MTAVPCLFTFSALVTIQLREFKQKELKSGREASLFTASTTRATDARRTLRKRKSAVALLGGCPLAFCEDCADWEGQMAIVPEQPPHLLRKFGFLQCNQAVYCYCTPLCQQVADETDVLVLGKNHPAVKAVEKRKKLDAELAKALAAGQDPAMLRQQEKAKKAAQQRANQMGLLENVYAKPKPKSYVSYNGASSASAPTLTGATAPAVVEA